MRLRSRFALIAAPLGVALSLAPTAAARSSAVTVSGRVTHASGYTLLALTHSGSATSVKLGASGSFQAKVQRDVTLQLLRPNHRFFGPVVLTHAKGRAYEALSGRSVKLGTIKLRADYAAPVKSLGSTLADLHVWARADKAGKPVGAGNLGLLPKKGRARSALAHAAQAGQPGSGQGGNGQSGNGGGQLPAGGDPTHVGIVTAFNADVTGAGVPNAENPQSAQASGDGLFSEMNLQFVRSFNADAAGVTPAQLSDFVKSYLRLDFYLDGHAAGGAQVSGVTVDCGTLVYCASGTGTATTQASNNTNGIAPDVRWDGTVPSNPNSPGVFSINVAPNVGTAQIQPGDVFGVRYHTSGGDQVRPTSLTLYFLTVPALASYDTGDGTHSVSYPVGQDAPGTDSNPIPMSSGRITMNLWRPQRAALPGESGSLYDMGHLHYGVAVRAQGANREAGCASQFYSGLSPTLATSQASQDQFYNQLFPLHDSADDAPVSSVNQIHFSLDLAGCLAADGIPTNSVVDLPITAVDEARRGGTDRGVQTIAVCLPGCTVSQGASGSPAGSNPGS